MKTKRSFEPNLNRYYFDGKYSCSKGWAQMDTHQDAPYYGHWFNPFERRFISFMESDVCVIVFDDDDEMKKYMDDEKEYHRNNKSKCRLDPGFNEELRQKIKDLGMEEFLYPTEKEVAC